MALTASNRVNLIKFIAERLQEEGESIAHMTLDKFGIQRVYISEEEYFLIGDRTLLDQLLERRDRAQDDSLQALGAHFKRNPSPSIDIPHFWKKGCFRLFISHLANHRKTASEIGTKLLDFGISCFVAHHDIEPTTEWQDQIESALQTCDGVLALFHPGFRESDWTDQEIGYALCRQLLIVPVRLGMDPYGFIGRFQAMDGPAEPACDFASRLFETLSKNPKTREKIAQGAMQAFEESNFFKDAMRRMSHLEKLEFWDASLCSRARAVLHSNNQISKAYGVPERLHELLKKRECVAI